MPARPGDPEDEARDPSEWRGSPARASAEEILRRLAQGRRGFERFVVLDEIDHGGMGVVLRVHDPELHRTLAVKRLHGQLAQAARSGASPQTTRHIARFVDEAQVTAQLDHPGIVPVHEIGLDGEGNPYFAMKLVRGETLREVFRHAREGAQGWSTVRATGVLLRICEAMAYAHEHGVVHRDLKPGNVMVGRHGEVYVVDWGLARVLHERDGSTATQIDSRRHEGGTGSGSSPLVTEAGEVFGSPPYMAPEQAFDSRAATPQADVYAVGAMLYHLLCGHAPYMPPDRQISAQEVWSRLKQGPPEPVEALAAKAPQELASICNKAMARDPAVRYATMQELADDLRAFLENRVVRAHRTGPLVELRKWTARNRGAAAALAALVVVVASAGFVVARQKSGEAEAARRDAWERAVIALPARLDGLPPLANTTIRAWDGWLADARAALAREPEVEGEVAAIERTHTLTERVPDPSAAAARPDPLVLDFLNKRQEVFEAERGKLLALPADGPRPDWADHDLEVLQLEHDDPPPELAAEKERLAAFRDWRWADPEVEARYARLLQVRRALRSLGSGGDGLAPRVAATLTRARAAVREHAAEWAAAAAEIADRTRSPRYDGLRLAPQLGLVPLGRDPQSGLFEFWHTPSGTRPARGADGRWQVRPETGLVFVLVPGGTSWMGAQDQDPAAPNYVPKDPVTGAGLAGNERWLVPVQLDPYFLASHETTQGQWLRLTGANPSREFAGTSRIWRLAGGERVHIPRWTRTHPVESVSWDECVRALARWGLGLPTEAQWERAARAGTTLPFGQATTTAELALRTNHLDEATRAVRRLEDVPDRALVEAPDHYPFHAPVDAFPPNAFGLHGMLGNVSEWCRDWFAETCEQGGFVPGTGEHRPKFARAKPVRGGSYLTPLPDLRVSRRHDRTPNSADQDLGVRAARPVEPGTDLESKEEP